MERERSAEREVAERERNGKGTGSGGYRNRLEREAAFFAAHAPLIFSESNQFFAGPVSTCV